MKQFIKKHPHHSILYGIGGTFVAAIAVMGGLIWNSSNQLYAEQVNRHSPAYIASLSQALSGTSSSTQSTAKATTPTTTQTAAPTPVTTSSTAATTPAPAPTAVSSSSLRGLKLYVDPSRASLPAPLSTSAVATWLGNWNVNVQTDTNNIVTAATNAGAVATLVAYDIPGRDCGSYSAGGANGSDAYKAWIRSVAAGIGNRQAIVILEPDALAQITCLDSAGQASRYALLQDAVNVLTTQTRAFVYLDAGHSGWIDATTMASRLQQAGIAQATGFSLNVSNFETTANNTSYGNTVSSKVGGKHFVIDTGRNGNGPGDTWCNPAGRALGESPTTTPSASGSSNVDAYLWIKVPGESDGTCNGGPSAGTYWSAYAQSLIANRH